LSIGATLVHVGLWHGKEIFGSMLESFRGKPIDVSA
jgi:hypothetical protein